MTWCDYMHNNSRTRINLIVAADISQKMRFALEFSVVVALILGLTAIAVPDYNAYFARGELTESLVLSSTVKADMMAFRAERGEWPASQTVTGSSALPEGAPMGRYVDYMTIGENGSLTAVFRQDSGPSRLNGQRLTIRPLTITGAPGAPVPWVCGSHGFPRDLTPGGIDETDVEVSVLPAICRGD